MSATDRTQWKQVMIGELGASRTVSNAAQAVSQDAQRFHSCEIGIAASTAGTTYTLEVARFDRPVKVVEFRALPGAALTSSDANYDTIALNYTNDAGGSVVVVSTATTKTAGSGGTGSWVAQTSVSLALTAANVALPTGSNMYITLTPTGTGVAFAAGTRFQVIVEEV